MKRIIGILVIQILFAVSVFGQSVEYAVKSALLLKIAQNIEWSNLDKQSQFTIQVVGKSPFRSELDRASAQMQKINGQPIRVSYLSEVDLTGRPQVVFICPSEKKKFDKILTLLKNEPDILVVADSPDYSGKGVHINFYSKTDGSVHFELDLRAFQSDELRPSIQLLKISKIIR